MLSRLFGRKRKVFILSLDGVPYSFLKKAFDDGVMPNFSRLVGEGSFVRMNSVIPTISSVAWSSFMTGKNPAKHGIFGFVDRNPETLELFIPTSTNMRCKTLWEILSEHGRRVVVMNVPVTYPPRKVNGILISGFLATKLEKATYPEELWRKLEGMGYVIDVDSWKAKDKRDEFLRDLDTALERRREAAFHFLRNERWDFFMCHIMETDRINHFFWDGDAEYAERFSAFYRKIDDLIGDIVPLAGNSEVIILSDHGFCPIRKEVFLNRWLMDNGYLKLKSPDAKDLRGIDPETKAYSLIPGRIFLNLEGRELTGSVPRANYEILRNEIIEGLKGLRDPDTGEPMIKDIYRREEIYSGEFLDEAADIIAFPHDGYDLKGTISPRDLTGRSHILGMHTYDDAFLFIRGRDVPEDRPIYIQDVTSTILKLMDIPEGEDMDGKALL